MRQDNSQVLQFSVPFAPRIVLCSNFFVYFCRNGSRVYSRNSHSGVLVTGLASTLPPPCTRAPPGAQGLHCPIVFIPVWSCLLFFFSCPHNILCWSHLERKSGPLARRSLCRSAPACRTSLASHAQYLPRARSSVTRLLLSLSGCLCPICAPGAPLPGAFRTFHTLGRAPASLFI